MKILHENVPDLTAILHENVACTKFVVQLVLQMKIIEIMNYELVIQICLCSFDRLEEAKMTLILKYQAPSYTRFDRFACAVFDRWEEANSTKLIDTFQHKLKSMEP
jgi:hypothetical protein